MIAVRPSSERGHADHGWLDTHHTFSFADYYDPQHMGFGALRVINEDWIAPASGFPMHAHRDMEIITYVLQGSLEHKDSMGNGSVIRPGEVQRMSAGTGVKHSEYNASPSESCHLLQIWIEPDQRGVTPGYEQKRLDLAGREARFRLIASPDGRDNSVTIHRQAFVYASVLKQGEAVTYHPQPGRKIYLQVARGAAAVNGVSLTAGDGARITDEESVELAAGAEGAEALLFDLDP